MIECLERNGNLIVASHAMARFGITVHDTVVGLDNKAHPTIPIRATFALKHGKVTIEDGLLHPKVGDVLALARPGFHYRFEVTKVGAGMVHLGRRERVYADGRVESRTTAVRRAAFRGVARDWRSRMFVRHWIVPAAPPKVRKPTKRASLSSFVTSNRISRMLLRFSGHVEMSWPRFVLLNALTSRAWSPEHDLIDRDLGAGVRSGIAADFDRLGSAGVTDTLAGALALARLRCPACDMPLTRHSDQCWYR